jgi:hypothetical protein
LWVPSVEDQESGGVVSYLQHLGVAHQESRTQLYGAGFRPRDSSLMISMEGTMVLNADLYSMNSILT